MDRRYTQRIIQCLEKINEIGSTIWQLHNRTTLYAGRISRLGKAEEIRKDLRLSSQQRAMNFESGIFYADND
jgi:hypothetical protein